MSGWDFSRELPITRTLKVRDTIRTMIFQNQDTAALYFFLAKRITICNATWQLHIALFGRAGSLGMT